MPHMDDEPFAILFVTNGEQVTVGAPSAFSALGQFRLGQVAGQIEPERHVHRPEV